MLLFEQKRKVCVQGGGIACYWETIVKSRRILEFPSFHAGNLSSRLTLQIRAK